MPRRAITVERKVYFYRTIVAQHYGGQTLVFDHAAACQHINGLRFITNSVAADCRYMEGSSPHEVTCVWPKGNEPKLCIATVRKGGLPHTEQGGEISPLNIGRAGLLEQTHIRFFDDGIVGAEFNFYGPRISRLAEYFAAKCPSLPMVTFAPLLNRDAQEQFDHLGDVRLLQLRLHRSSFDLLKQGNEHLSGLFSVASEELEAPVVEITLRPEPRSRRTLGKPVWDLVQFLVGEPKILEGAQVFRVRGFDDRNGRVSPFDFLSDKFVVARHVVKQTDRYRAIDSDSMFDAIEDAYASHRSELQTAMAIS